MRILTTWIACLRGCKPTRPRCSTAPTMGTLISRGCRLYTNTTATAAALGGIDPPTMTSTTTSTVLPATTTSLRGI